MQGNIQLATVQGNLLASREIQRPVAVGRLLGRHYLVLCSHDVGIQTHEGVAMPLERVFCTCIYRPRRTEGQRVALLLA